MLYGLTKFKTQIDDLFKQINNNPLAELEFRLGTYKHGRFSAGMHPKLLRESLEEKNVIFKMSQYTVMLFENGDRMRDGKMQNKKQICRLDMDYAPVAVRLNLALETAAGAPSIDAVPTSTREIERWSAYLPGFDKVQIDISQVGGEWEIELEFSEHPLTEDELFQPLQYVLQLLLPDRKNMVAQTEIVEIASAYNAHWSAFPESGFLRKLGYKPMNFVETDFELLRTHSYATSNKLDGAKYTLITHGTDAFAVSETDAMWLGKSAKPSQFTFDGEWDFVDHTLLVFDFQTEESLDLQKRLTFTTTVINRMRLSSVQMKHILLDTPAKDTIKIKLWMEKTYGKLWKDRNDGIMYTPITANYLAGKDRELRTLKYKLPDKISIDERVRVIKNEPKEKIFRTFAQGPHDEIETKDIKITIASSDPYFNIVKDGDIVEIGIRDAGFYVMRLRNEKTHPNFITVVQETLKDMRNPISLEILLARLHLKKGGEKLQTLLPEVTATQREKALTFVADDRKYFRKVYDIVLKFIQRNSLKLSNPECLVTTDVIPNIVVCYTSTGLKSANDLANLLFQLTPVVFMKTVIPYEEFDISVLNRQIVKFLNYPRVRHIHTDKLFSSHPLKIYDFALQSIDAEIELIEVYHRLYMPFPEKWEKLLAIEETLSQLVKTRFTGGACAPHEVKNEFARTVRKAMHTAMEFNDVGILIGHWGYYELFPTSDPHNEKVQIISDIEPDALQEKLENILRDITPLKLSFKTEEIGIPTDMQIRKTTYYFDFKGQRVPLLDAFNSTTYEMIPYLTFGDKKIKVGNPYVLSRFFLIDRWILAVLKQGKCITEDVMKKKSRVLIDKVIKLRLKKDLVFGEEYHGIYKDFAIERRKLLKKEEKFRPYKPLDYHTRFGKLREIAT